MEYNIDHLRRDLESLSELTTSSPLYLEIEECTKMAYSKLAESLKYDAIDQADALQLAVQHLLAPMSATSPTNPLEYYLIHELERRRSNNEDFELAEFRRILVTSIRRSFLSLNRTEYLQNLVSRSQRLLSVEPYEAIGPSQKRRYSSLAEGSRWLDIKPDEETLTMAANKCSHIEKIPQTSTTKSSPVYTTENLSRILAILISEAKCVSRADLFFFFSKLLTNWVSRTLIKIDDSADPYPGSSTAPADAAIGDAEFADQHAKSIWFGLTENERRFFHASTWKVTQEAIASRVEFLDTRDPSVTRRYTRTSVINIQNKLHASLYQALKEFDDDDRTLIATALLTLATYYEY